MWYLMIEGKRRPVLLEKPDSLAAQGLQRIAGRLLTLDGHGSGGTTP